MAVDIATSSEDALFKIDVTPYDLLVLDRQMPGINGDDVCAHLVGRPERPRILMLTAAGEIDDRVSGLELGADDYLVKPFVMAELVARLRAIARRPSLAIPPVHTLGDVTIDTTRRNVKRGDRVIQLTRKEFGVLEMLAVANGRVVSSEELLDHMWDEMADPFTNAVRITMMTCVANSASHRSSKPWSGSAIGWNHRHDSHDSGTIGPYLCGIVPGNGSGFAGFHVCHAQ